MSRRNTILAGIIFMFLGYFVFSSRSAGIANTNSLDGTGSPLSSITCGDCHSGGNFNADASLQLFDANNVPVTSYVPGEIYTVILQVTGSAPFYGAQAVALTSSNSNAGTMGAPTTTQTNVVNLNGVDYLEQNAKSSTGTFSVPWTAPSAGTGTVNFHFIGNAVNGSGTGGDEATPAMIESFSEAPLPTCSDGIMNQDETGIDCGGANCPPCEPTLYVDQMATGNNDGSSWSDAYTDLQDALAIGVGFKIKIAAGTYYPTSGTGRGIAFDVPNSSSLEGGYPNGGGDRNPGLYETILSGNIDGVSTYGGNSFHVVRVKDVDNVLLDGLTIRDGNADNANSFGRSRGGGLYVVNSTITLRDCEVKWNKAIYGAGVFATLSPSVEIQHSTFVQNEAEFGSALYHSNMTNMYIRSSRISNNISNFRCAVEINNSLYTLIENSIIANNQAANANAVAYIATNRNQTSEIYNSTIIGGSNNKALMTFQVGNNDMLDVNIYNTIIAHQDLNFDKNVVAFNNNILNLNTENCYIQGSTIIGNSTSNLYSDIVGDLMANPDFSLDACSPAVDMGNNANANGLSVDIDGNDRFFGTIDMGAYESQSNCGVLRQVQPLNESGIYPNPTSSFVYLNDADNEETMIHVYDALGQLKVKAQGNRVDLSSLPTGMYIVSWSLDGKILSSERVLKK